MGIEVDSISKAVKGNAILSEVSVGFEPGGITVLRGMNGSGKTMLMRAISGLIRLDAGEVRIDGKVLKRDIEFPPSIGALIDAPAFIPRFSGFDNLKMLPDLTGRIGAPEVRATLEAVGLDPSDRRAVGKYSLGMRKRLGIACAVMERPRIVLLDEPFNALDREGVQLIRQLIASLRSPERIIIVANHDESSLEGLEDRIVRMEAGRIVGIEERAADAEVGGSGGEPAERAAGAGTLDGPTSAPGVPAAGERAR